MHVITAENMKVPKPSAEWTQKLRASMIAFAGSGDPLTTSLCAENWPGREAVHCICSVGLRTILDLKELDENRIKPFCWRFLAGGHKKMTTAAGCWATYEVDGLPAKVMAVLRGPEMAEILTNTEQLNHLSEICDCQSDRYELRVLRIPALSIEAFWLKSQSVKKGDLIVPYGLIVDAGGRVKFGAGGRLTKNRAYPAAEFLDCIREASRKHLETDRPRRARAKSAG